MTSTGAFSSCEAISAACPVEATTYGYYPSIAASGTFIFIFGLCCVSQLYLGIRYQTYSYMVAASLGIFGEAVGYGGRVMMNHNPWSEVSFRIQIVCLILAPSFLAASIYLTLKHLVKCCGEQYSRLKPAKYTWIFIGADFGSILLQAAGGGIAAGGVENPRLADVGNGLIVAGIVFQAVTMLLFAVLIGEFYWRMRNKKPVARNVTPASATAPGSQEKTPAGLEQSGDTETFPKSSRFMIFCWGIGFAFLTIFVRCLYRIPEMAGGWGGERMRHEVEFCVLDGMMIALAATTLTAFHPGYFFPQMRRGWQE